MAKVLINTGKSNDDIARKHFSSEKKLKQRKSTQKVPSGKLDESKEALVFSVLSKVFVYQKKAGKFEIAERHSAVTSLCYHDGGLYEGTLHGIISNTFASKRVAERKPKDEEKLSPINALCSHKDVLYDAGDYGVYETFNNKRVAKARGIVQTLCSYDGELYDGGDYHCIHTTLNAFTIRKAALKFVNKVDAMCTHKGKLYFSSKGGFFEFDKKVKSLGLSSVLTNDFCSYEGNLCGSAQGGSIYQLTAGKAKLSTGRKLIETKQDVLAMCSVPKEFVKRVNENINQ